MAIESLADWLAWQDAQCVKGDAMTVIAGEEGRGKSTLGFQICWAFDHRFSHQDVFWSTGTWVDSISDRQLFPPRRAAMLDETVMGAYNLDFAKGENKDAEKFLMVMRERHLFNVAITTQWGKLGSYWRQRPRTLFVLDGLGSYVCHMRGERKQFSKKDPGYWPVFRGTFDEILPDDGDLYREFKLYEQAKADASDRFKQGMEAEQPTRTRKWSKVAEEVLRQDGLL